MLYRLVKSPNTRFNLTLPLSWKLLITLRRIRGCAIPKEARDVFGINPGDTLIVLADIEKGIAIPPKNMFAHFMETIFNKNTPEESEK